jgi:transcriptional regulator with XRE-family HTH domain
MISKRNKPTTRGSDQPKRPARTAEDLARYKAIRERFQREKPSLEKLVSSGEYNEPLPMGEYLSIRQAVFALKKAREAAGLSLADVAERTGIDKAALSRIETGQHMNPTVSTLCRYAHALGKRWKWVLEEEVGAGGDAKPGDERTCDLAQGVNEIRRVSRRERFLQARRDAEESARRLLNRRAGSFTRDDLCRFLDHCNTEVVPPDASSEELRAEETLTRFQQSFIGQNRVLMLGSLKACNELIGGLWKADEEDIDALLDRFWRSSPRSCKGAGTGLPTMILYLKDPDQYSVWLVDSLGKALSKASGRRLPSTRTAASYRSYNRAVEMHLRNPFRLDPQEIDYILYRLVELMPLAGEEPGPQGSNVDPDGQGKPRQPG